MKLYGDSRPCSCPERSVVIDSRVSTPIFGLPTYVRRRRCLTCDQRWSTYEIPRAALASLQPLLAAWSEVERIITRLAPVISEAQTMVTGLDDEMRARHRIQWSQGGDDQLRALVADGRSVRTIAHQLGCTANTVREHAERLGLTIAGSRPFHHEDGAA